MEKQNLVDLGHQQLLDDPHDIQGDQEVIKPLTKVISADTAFLDKQKVQNSEVNIANQHLFNERLENKSNSEHVKRSQTLPNSGVVSVVQAQQAAIKRQYGKSLDDSMDVSEDEEKGLITRSVFSAEKARVGLKSKLIDDIELNGKEADQLIEQIVPEDDDILEGLGTSRELKTIKDLQKKSLLQRNEEESKQTEVEEEEEK